MGRVGRLCFRRSTGKIVRRGGPLEVFDVQVVSGSTVVVIVVVIATRAACVLVMSV